jgi:hypothetical protein
MPFPERPERGISCRLGRPQQGTAQAQTSRSGARAGRSGAGALGALSPEPLDRLPKRIGFLSRAILSEAAGGAVAGANNVRN